MSTRRKRGNSKKREREREREQCGQSPCATTHGHFRPKMIHNFSLQFSLYFEEKTFWCAQREKI